MAKFIDLSGQRFGRLVALEAIRKNGIVYWKCLCDCGGTTTTTCAKLKSGHTKSCGCLQRERTSEASKKDLTKMKFGRLTVLERVSKMGEHAKYRCKCDCGTTIIVEGGNLVTGATKSCGCIRSEMVTASSTKHGGRKTKLYKVWRNMLNRCNNPKNKEYHCYGGRGIKVCPEWATDFSAFRDWALSNGYHESLTIERIDVNAGYFPENCMWADRYIQSRNRTNNRKISFQGRTMILVDWAKETGFSESTIRRRLNRGWSVERALTTETKRPNGAGHKPLSRQKAGKPSGSCI